MFRIQGGVTDCGGLSETGPQKFIVNGVTGDVILLEYVWPYWKNCVMVGRSEVLDVQSRPSVTLSAPP